MKHLLLILSILFLAACSEPAPMPSPDPTPNEPAPTEPAPTDPEDPMGPEPEGPLPGPDEGATLASVTFMNSGRYDTSGTAEIVREGDALRLELGDDFKTDAGPDLYVWLVKDIDSPEGFYEVAELQRFEGAQTYELNLVNIDDYEAIYIWCKDFGVLFGSGVLEKN